MECFRIDESGYTGFDLLNPEQHFQGATAVAITDEDATRLIKEHFPKLQASELKYRTLSRRPGNHPRLLGLQRDILAGPYRVEHDQSKNLLTYHALLQRYINHDQDIEFRQSEIARIKFPLKLASVTQVDSKTSPAVQLADVMIGAAIEATNTLTGQRTGGLDPQAVMSLYADNQIIHLLPSIDFDAQKRFRQGTQAAEVIDYFARNFGGTSS
jgi:hypothetical protein